MLVAYAVLVPFGNNLVTAKLGPELRPAEPVEDTEQQNRDANDWEDVVWVALSVPVTIRRNEGNKREENIGGEIDNGNGKVRVPWRLPTLLLAVVEVDKTSGDKGIDPGTGVCVQIGNEVVRRSGRRGNQYDDGDEPVQEKGSRRCVEWLVRRPEAAPR